MKKLNILYSLLLISAVAVAQAPDRSAPPALGKAKNLALPAIQKDYGYSSSGLQWIFNAYVILLGGLLLLGGKLSDMFGARKMYIWGFGIITAAT